MNSDYDFPDAFQQDSDIQVESSLPYGVQNVYAVSGRLARSRNNRHKVSFPRKNSRAKRSISNQLSIFDNIQSTFQSLCLTKRETVYLNLDPDFEYRPDYYEEVRCANAVPLDENRIPAAVSQRYFFFGTAFANVTKHHAAFLILFRNPVR